MRKQIALVLAVLLLVAAPMRAYATGAAAVAGGTVVGVAGGTIVLATLSIFGITLTADYMLQPDKKDAELTKLYEKAEELAVKTGVKEAFDSFIEEASNGVATCSDTMWQFWQDMAEICYINEYGTEFDDNFKEVVAGKLYDGISDEVIAGLSYPNVYHQGMTWLAQQGYQPIAVGVTDGIWYIWFDEAENISHYVIGYGSSSSKGYSLINEVDKWHNEISEYTERAISHMKLEDRMYSTEHDVIYNLAGIPYSDDIPVVENPNKPDTALDISLNVFGGLTDLWEKRGTLDGFDILTKGQYWTDAADIPAVDVPDLAPDIPGTSDEDAKVVAGARSWAIPAEAVLEKLATGEITWEQYLESIGCIAVEKEVAADGEVVSYVSAVTDVAKVITNDGVEDEMKAVDVFLPTISPSATDEYTADLTKIFPFCIPFDFYRLIELFNAPAKAPVFKVPFKYADVIDYTFELDFSEYASLARICRLFETIAFCFVLMKLTGKFMKW